MLVPVHEALHVLGCLATGGSVTRLEISPLFGGTLFARLWPWVTTETEYAGRLAGFRPAGDLSYLVTVLAPLVLLCAAGSPLARLAVRKRSAWLLGFSLGAALQPLAAITGDCYEAASIPLTRLASLGGLDWAMRLRGDDLVKVANQAAAAPSPLAWLLFAGGCVGGILIAVATLVVCGGIAPRIVRPPAKDGADRWTRRSLLRTGVGAVLLGSSGWILTRLYFPRRLGSDERRTFAVLVDVLVPTAEFGEAQRAALVQRLLQDCDTTRRKRRVLVTGLRVLNAKAAEYGVADFAALTPAQRETVVGACAQSADGTVARVFYRTVRDRAMELVYSQSITWARLRFPHPPQPDGYRNYREPPVA